MSPLTTVRLRYERSLWLAPFARLAVSPPAVTCWCRVLVAHSIEPHRPGRGSAATERSSRAMVQPGAVIVVVSTLQPVGDGARRVEIVQLATAGVASTWPRESMARTRKVCVPLARPLSVRGLVHDVQA